MRVHTAQHDDTIIAQLSGEIDTTDQEGFADALRAIEVMRPRAVVLDFAGVTYIASQGIGMLLKFNSTIRAAGGTVGLSNVSAELQTVLDTVRLTSLMPVHKSTVAAIAAMA